MSSDAALGIIVLIYLSVPALIYGGEFIWWIFFSKSQDKKIFISDPSDSIIDKASKEMQAIAIAIWPLTLFALIGFGLLFIIYFPFKVLYDRAVKYRERRINAIKISRHSQE